MRFLIHFEKRPRVSEYTGTSPVVWMASEFGSGNTSYERTVNIFLEPNFSTRPANETKLPFLMFDKINFWLKKTASIFPVSSSIVIF